MKEEDTDLCSLCCTPFLAAGAAGRPCSGVPGGGGRGCAGVHPPCTAHQPDTGTAYGKSDNRLY